MSRLNGSEDSPIIVRQYPGERATLDGGSLTRQGSVLDVNGSYTWFWGFEITCSGGDRYADERGSDPEKSDLQRSEGVDVGNNGENPGIKFINLVVHDTRQGFSIWDGSINAEVYGCLVYYNGWVSSDRGHGHGIYTQNTDGSRLIADNISFSNLSHGIHAYGSDSARIDDITLEGNVLFNNPERNFLLGGSSVAHNPILTGNFSYNGGGAGQLGHAAGFADGILTGNYFLKSDGTIALRFRSVDASEIETFANNFVWGDTDGFSTRSFSDNTSLSDRPEGVRIFVRPNAYEEGRANIVVLNFEGRESVSVDVGDVLNVGDAFELRDAQNFFGSPALSGTYHGGALEVPMDASEVVEPVGDLDGEYVNGHTSSEFGVFILVRTERSSGSNPSPEPEPEPAPASGSEPSPVPQAGNGSILTGVTLAGVRNDYTGYMGTRLTVGDRPITVTALGRMVARGNSGKHIVKLVSVENGRDVTDAAVSINLGGGDEGSMRYGQLARPITLSANTSYYLVSEETNRGDFFYDNDASVTTTTDVRIDASVYLSEFGWTENGYPGRSYGVVDLLYSVSGD
jgi:hypothetical protein